MIYSIILAISLGFKHAFEADHLLAISNIVSNRNSLKKAAKDGIFWGIGHTLTIMLIAGVMLIFKVLISERIFGYLEMLVGVMLILLGVFRLYKFYTKDDATEIYPTQSHNHRLALSTGIIHGLAGSGAAIILISQTVKSDVQSLIFLLVFGLGSILGMLLAASIFNLPYAKKFTTIKKLQEIFVITSSVLCIIYGMYIIYNKLSIFYF